MVKIVNFITIEKEERKEPSDPNHILGGKAKKPWDDYCEMNGQMSEWKANQGKILGDLRV